MCSRTPFSMLSWLSFASLSASAANPLPLPVKDGSYRVAFSPDGQYLVTAGTARSGSSLLLWRLSNESSTLTDYDFRTYR